MHATTIRRRMLATWLRQRAEPPTAARLLRHAAPQEVVTWTLLRAAVLAMFWTGDRFAEGLGAGLLTCLVIGIVVRLRVAPVPWPHVAGFLDWPRIEQAARDEGLS